MSDRPQRERGPRSEKAEEKIAKDRRQAKALKAWLKNERQKQKRLANKPDKVSLKEQADKEILAAQKALSGAQEEEGKHY